MEALAPVLVDDLTLVLHELPAGTHVLVCDPERVRTRAADLVRTSQEFLDASWAAAAGGGAAPIDLGAASLRDLDDVAGRGRRGSACRGGRQPFGADDECARRAPSPTAAELPRRHRRGDRPTSVGWTRDGWRVALVFDGHGSAQRAVERLAAAEVAGPAASRNPSVEAGRRRRDHRPARRRVGRAVAQARVPHRGRPHRPARLG